MACVLLTCLAGSGQVIEGLWCRMTLWKQLNSNRLQRSVQHSGIGIKGQTPHSRTLRKDGCCERLQTKPHQL